MSSTGNDRGMVEAEHTKPGDDWWHRLIALVMSAIAVAFLVTTAFGAFRFWSPVPYWDMWDSYVGFWLNAANGGLDPWWQQHNEHRIVLAKAFFWLDFQATSGTGLLLVILNLLAMTAIAITLVLLLRMRLRESLAAPTSWWNFAALASVVVIVSVSWMQGENLWWPFQIQFLLATLLPLGAFTLLGLAATRRSRTQAAAFALAATLCLVLSPLTISGGVLAPIVAVALLISLRVRSRWIVAMGVIALIVVLVYLVGFQRVPGHSNPVDSLLRKPLDVAVYVFAYMGGPISNATGSAFLAALSGLGFVVLFGYCLWKGWKSRDSEPLALVPLAFVTYVVLGACATALGRVDFGPGQAFASRYQTPVLVAWACMFIVVSPSVYRWLSQTTAAKAFGLLLIPILLLPAQGAVFADVSQRRVNYATALLALSLQVPDSQATSAVYPDAERVISLSAEVASRGRTVLAQPPWSDLMRAIGSQSDPLGPIAPCIGHVDTLTGVAGSSMSRVTGWVAAIGGLEAEVPIPILDEEGVVNGYIIWGVARPDVLDAVPEAGPSAGFSGYVLSDYSDQMVLRGRNGACSLSGTT